MISAKKIDILDYRFFHRRMPMFLFTFTLGFVIIIGEKIRIGDDVL